MPVHPEIQRTQQALKAVLAAQQERLSWLNPRQLDELRSEADNVARASDGTQRVAAQMIHALCEAQLDTAIFNGNGGASVPASRGSSVASPHQPQFSHEPATVGLSNCATASSAASDPNSNTGRTHPANNTLPSPAGS